MVEPPTRTVHFDPLNIQKVQINKGDNRLGIGFGNFYVAVHKVLALLLNLTQGYALF